MKGSSSHLFALLMCDLHACGKIGLRSFTAQMGIQGADAGAASCCENNKQIEQLCSLCISTKHHLQSSEHVQLIPTYQ
jgi:hypothetical protein